MPASSVASQGTGLVHAQTRTRSRQRDYGLFSDRPDAFQ